MVKNISFFLFTMLMSTHSFANYDVECIGPKLGKTVLSCQSIDQSLSLTIRNCENNNNKEVYQLSIQKRIGDSEETLDQYGHITKVSVSGRERYFTDYVEYENSENYKTWIQKFNHNVEEVKSWRNQVSIETNILGWDTVTYERGQQPLKGNDSVNFKDKNVRLRCR